MNDELEIDLRKVIRSLLRRWMWIVSIALLLGVLALVFSLLQPRLYEAKAVIALTRPPYQPNFDSRYQSLSPITLNSKMVTDVALGDEILGQLLNFINQDTAQQISAEKLREKLKIEAGSDQSVLILSARMKKAEDAQRLVNLWSDLVVDRVNTIYSGRDENQVAFFEEQIELAARRLELAGKNLEAFENRNESAILINQKNSLLAMQNEALRRQRMIEVVNRDAQLLLQQLNALPDNSTLPPYEQTNLFLLYSRVYADTLTPLSPMTSTDTQVVISQNNAGTQLMIPIPEANQQLNKETAVLLLETWLESLKRQNAEIEAVMEQIKNQIENLQQRIQALENEKKRLELEWTTASETYTTLSRKYDETRIAASDSSGFARVASYAEIPDNPAPRGTLRNTALATALGAFLAVCGVLVWDWWRSEEEPVPRKEEILAKEPLMVPKR